MGMGAMGRVRPPTIQRPPFEISRGILDHLGLSTPEAEKPPPLRESLRVAEHGEGWGVPAEWE